MSSGQRNRELERSIKLAQRAGKLTQARSKEYEQRRWKRDHTLQTLKMLRPADLLMIVHDLLRDVPANRLIIASAMLLSAGIKEWPKEEWKP